MEALPNLVENLQDVKDALMDDCDKVDIHIAKVCNRLRGFANDLVEPPGGLDHTDDGLAHLRTPPPSWVSAAVDNRADETFLGDSELDEASEGSGSFDEAEEAQDTPAAKKERCKTRVSKRRQRQRQLFFLQQEQPSKSKEDEDLIASCLREQRAANKEAALIASATKKVGNKNNCRFRARGQR